MRKPIRYCDHLTFSCSCSTLKRHTMYYTACSGSAFYYNGRQSIIDHNCSHPSSCQSTMISAIFADSIHIGCSGQFACDMMDIYSALNDNAISTVAISSKIDMDIYSLHGLSNLNVNCYGKCEMNAIHVLYGMGFAKSICSLSDCMHSANHVNVTYLEHNLLESKDGQSMLLLDPEMVSNKESMNLTLQRRLSSTLLHLVCVNSGPSTPCSDINLETVRPNRGPDLISLVFIRHLVLYSLWMEVLSI